MTARASDTGTSIESAADGLAALRAELGVPEHYSAEVLRTADAAIRSGLSESYDDVTDIPFVTLDPPGSTDLDQAFHLARRPGGFLVHYAIADVAAFVRPGSALDVDTHHRGVTYYGPDGRFGLHPPMISEAAASLLPGQDRPAAVWRMELDGDGVLTDVTVRRAMVRSRKQLTYSEVQRALDAGTAPEMVELLPEVGRRRLELQIARGGATLDVPEQEVAREVDRYRLVYRAPLPVEEHNAQLSLMTGMAAARLHREAGVGIWRTLPPAPDEELARLRRVAVGLGLNWEPGQSYGAFAATLDARNQADAAFATEATRLFRGAGYESFGTASNPRVSRVALHSAIGAEYAHVTAPIRRLVDRYGAEVALAHCAGRSVPDWVLSRLDDLPSQMASAVQRASGYERGCLDLLEALILQSHVGETFEGMVVATRNVVQAESTEDVVRATVLLQDPAVRAKVTGPAAQLRPGHTTRVVVRSVDVAKRHLDLAPAPL